MGALFQMMQGKLSIDYELTGAGWAELKWTDAGETLYIAVSYLHDSLGQLAQSALELKKLGSAKVFFLDEPGEHHLFLDRAGESLNYEIRWFDDWASWGIHPPDKYEIVLAGSTSARRCQHQVVITLHRVLEQYGLEGYKEQWVQHEFPEEKYRQLQDGE